MQIISVNFCIFIWNCWCYIFTCPIIRIKLRLDPKHEGGLGFGSVHQAFDTLK